LRTKEDNLRENAAVQVEKTHEWSEVSIRNSLTLLVIPPSLENQVSYELWTDVLVDFNIALQTFVTINKATTRNAILRNLT
jgi:hypothetical protein